MREPDGDCTDGSQPDHGALRERPADRIESDQEQDQRHANVAGVLLYIGRVGDRADEDREERQGRPRASRAK